MNHAKDGVQVPTAAPKVDTISGRRRPSVSAAGILGGRKSTPTAGKGMGYAGTLMSSRSR